MKVILIMVWISAANGAPAIHTAQFSNMKSCELAAEAYKMLSPNWGHKFATCVRDES